MRLGLIVAFVAVLLSSHASSADSCSGYAGSYYCNNGRIYSFYGNTLYDDQGKAWSSYGSNEYDEDHQSYSEYGNTLYGKRGKSWSVYGNTIYQPNGSTCSWYANTLYCQPAPGDNKNSDPQHSRAAILLQPGWRKSRGN